jgi:6-phosphofructokinase 1
MLKKHLWLMSALVEATASPNGVGLVTLMGRHAGFIACYAARAQNDTNLVLVPEVPFDLDGENGVIACLWRRLECSSQCSNPPVSHAT